MKKRKSKREKKEGRKSRMKEEFKSGGREGEWRRRTLTQPAMVSPKSNYS